MSNPSPAKHETTGQPIRVTFITWDADIDGVAVLHDGVEVWSENSFDSLDQYLKYFAPVGRPVIIEYAQREGGTLVPSESATS